MKAYSGEDPGMLDTDSFTTDILGQLSLNPNVIENVFSRKCATLIYQKTSVSKEITALLQILSTITLCLDILYLHLPGRQR